MAGRAIGDLMIIPGAIGAYNIQRSRNVDTEDLINWFLASAQPGTPKSSAWLSPTPGHNIWTVLPSAPVRGMFTEDGRLFAVGGQTQYELYNTRRFDALGTVALDGRSVTQSLNTRVTGKQLATVSAGHLYNYDLVSGVFSEVPLDFIPQMADYIDGYIVALERATNTIRWSALEDNTSWPALNFARLQQSSDNIVSLKNIHDQLWLLGSRTSVVWANTGGSTTFQPIAGTLMQHGSGAEFSFAVLDNAGFWLEQSDTGAAQVVRGQGVGSVPLVVSSPAVSHALSQASRLDNTIGWAYQQEGHAFYVLYVPALDLNYVYDASVSSPESPIWHRRGLWNPQDGWHPTQGRCYAYAFGKHLVGDRMSGAIFELSPNFAIDWMMT